MNKLSIYIHIPFCTSKCLYCDFASGVATNDLILRYKQAIIDEIDRFDSDGYIVDSIFIGGGTPTSVDSSVLRDIVDKVRQKFAVDLVEFTVEGNPNSFTVDKVADYKRMGVTRVSVGVQSLQNNVLKAIGRAHDRQTALDCLDMLSESGLRVSADIMVGLPGQSIDSVGSDAEEIINRGVEHISCYSLILEEDTPLYRLVESGSVVLPNEDAVVDMYDCVANVARQHGLMRYEVSNFGIPCAHNVGYWRLKEYAGFGLSAHSLIGGRRYYNTSDMTEYLSGSGYIIEEELRLEDMAREYVMLGLRMDSGVDIDGLRRYGEDIAEKLLVIADSLREYIDITGEYFAIKPEYTYVANSIIEKFI